MNLTKTQNNFFQADSRKVAYIGGLGSGKSFVGILKALDQVSKGRVVLYLMPTQSMLNDVALPTLFEHLQTLGIDEDDYRFVRSPKINYYDKISGGIILFRSAEMGERLRGINAHDAFFDEAGYIERKVYDIVLGRLRKSEDAYIRIMTTPSGDDHWLYEEITSTKSDWTTHRQSTLKNPFLPKSYKLDLLKTYTGSYARQELDGEFISKVDSEQMIDMSKFNVCYERPGYINDDKILSVDIALYGDDKTAFVIMSGNSVEYMKAINGLNANQILETIIDLCLSRRIKRVVVDAVGIGDTFLQMAEEQFPSVEWIEFKGSHKSTKGNYNRRADSYVDLAKFIEEFGSMISLRTDDYNVRTDLKKQLASIRKMYNNGKLQLLSKEAMRKKGIKSPDIADALAMGCNILFQENHSESTKDVVTKMFK